MSRLPEGIGRADLHIHSMASDGIDGIAAILEHAEQRTDLDVIAITDHERIDAAVAAQHVARERGLRVDVIVGEEISTRSGHLLGLFLERRVRPWRSITDSIAEVHDQGGIAIVAHPLVPYPLCASGRTIRRLLDSPDARHHPDAIEAFNPTTAAMRWQRRIPAFVAQCGVAAVGNSDAHRASALGQGSTTFPGRSAQELRDAVIDRTTSPQGETYPWSTQFTMVSAQLRKNARAVGADVRGRILRDGTGRYLGYPGSHLRPIRFDTHELPVITPRGETIGEEAAQ